MAQTMTEKIFSEHAGREVHAGEIVRVDIDMIIGNDITTPISSRACEESGAEKLARPDNFCIVMDHYIPAKDIASANQAKISRDFAYKHDMKYDHMCTLISSTSVLVSINMTYFFLVHL